MGRMRRFEAWPTRVVPGVLVLAIGVCAPLSSGMCAAGRPEGSPIAETCAALCARLNCPMHRAASASAATDAPAMCQLHDGSSGSHSVVVKMMHTASTLPPQVFSQVPSRSAQTMVSTRFQRETVSLPTDAPPPRLS